MRIVKIALIPFTLLLASTIQAGPISFSGQFDPALATVQTNGGNGSVSFLGAPVSITITGSDSWSNNYIRTLVFWSITTPVTDLSFDWEYNTSDVWGPSWDPAGYCIDASCIQLSNSSGSNSQSGSVAGINLIAGQTFGFYVDTVEDDFGPAHLTITGAEVPEPATAGLVLVPLALLAGMKLRRKA